MIIRRYTGDSLESVRAAIRRELGDGAVVLHTRQYKKAGFLPGWGRTVYEATAVVEGVVDADAAGTRAAGEGPQLEPLLRRQQRQVEDLKRSIHSLTRRLAQPPVRPEESLHRPAPAADHPLLRDIHSRWRDRLLEQAGSPDGRLQADDVRAALAGMIPIAADLIRPDGAGRRTFVLAGPTGVGKTTTLAKLASYAVFTARCRVGLITLDTYRIAGVEQLREYAQLLGVELAVAFSEKELQSCLERFRDKEVLFVDTPGRGPFDRAGIADIQGKIGASSEVQTLLLAPAAVRFQDAASLVDGYRGLQPGGLIITKTDEASCCDGLTRLIELSGVPVAYLTTGQQVPEDIEQATGERVAALILDPAEARIARSREEALHGR